MGKTSLILRYVNNTLYDKSKRNELRDFYKKKVLVSGVEARLCIWDLEGSERFNGIPYGFYKNAVCVVIVYDVTEKSSFEKIESLLTQIQNYSDEEVLIVLIGNKIDLEGKRTVTKEDAMNYANKQNFSKYLETSVINDTDCQVEEIFTFIADRLLLKVKPKGSIDAIRNDTKNLENRDKKRSEHLCKI